MHRDTSPWPWDISSDAAYESMLFHWKARSLVTHCYLLIKCNLLSKKEGLFCNCLKVTVNLACYMSSNIPPPLPQPIQDFYNSGLKGKTWQATPLFDCYLGAIPWPKFHYNFSVKKKQPLMQLTTPSFTSQKTSKFTTNKSQVFTIGEKGIGKCHESRVRGITVTPTSLWDNQRGGLVDELHGM